MAQISGINGVMFYSHDIFKEARVPESMIQYAVLGSTSLMLITTLISVPLMDCAGRRKLLILPMCIMAASLAVLTAAMVEVRFNF